MTNQLVNETSPYLLQHAENPVNWMPWGPAALELAKKEKTLLDAGFACSANTHVA